MTAKAEVNTDRGKEVGEQNISTMVGKSIYAYKFQKADQAVTLAARPIVKVSSKPLTVDPRSFISYC